MLRPLRRTQVWPTIIVCAYTLRQSWLEADCAVCATAHVLSFAAGAGPTGKQLSGISYTKTGIFPESCWNPRILLDSLESFWNPGIFSESRNLVEIPGIFLEYRNLVGIPGILPESWNLVGNLGIFAGISESY